MWHAMYTVLIGFLLLNVTETFNYLLRTVICLYCYTHFVVLGAACMIIILIAINCNQLRYY